MLGSNCYTVKFGSNIFENYIISGEEEGIVKITDLSKPVD